jgi:hypothetical protein
MTFAGKAECVECIVAHPSTGPSNSVGVNGRVRVGVRPPKAKATRSNRVGCAKALSHASIIANRPVAAWRSM